MVQDKDFSFDLAPECWVRLHGLSKAKHLNGSVGQIVDGMCDPVSGRFRVYVHDSLYMKNGKCLVEDPTQIIRQMKKGPGGKLLRRENILVVPSDEMVSAVRYACMGELKEGVKQFQEVLLPKSHPFFKQAVNCPIPFKVGFPLVHSKLAVHPRTKLEHIKNRGLDREWLQNQPGTFLGCEVESGLSPNQDYVGPVLLGSANGFSDLTIDKAIEWNEYIFHLMGAYGERNFNPIKEITSDHFAAYRRRNPRSNLPPCDAKGDVRMPVPGEYELITSPLMFDFEVSRIGLDVNPFPRKKMEEWIKTEEYRKIFERFGDGEFADFHCDLDMLERMYVLACHMGEYYASLGDDDYESEPPLAFKQAQEAFRNIGWNLFYRAGMECMVVHNDCLQAAIKFSNLPTYDHQMAMEASVAHYKWDGVGTWIN